MGIRKDGSNWHWRNLANCRHQRHCGGLHTSAQADDVRDYMRVFLPLRFFIVFLLVHGFREVQGCVEGVTGLRIGRDADSVTGTP